EKFLSSATRNLFACPPTALRYRSFILMKVLWLVLLLAGIFPRAHSQDLLPDLVRRIKPSAVAIETFDVRGEKLSRGSGFFIDVDRVVTNRHVIDNAYRAEIHSYTGHVYAVKGVTAVDAEGDLAILRV